MQINYLKSTNSTHIHIPFSRLTRLYLFSGHSIFDIILAIETYENEIPNIFLCYFVLPTNSGLCLISNFDVSVLTRLAALLLGNLIFFTVTEQLRK